VRPPPKPRREVIQNDKRWRRDDLEKGIEIQISVSSIHFMPVFWSVFYELTYLNGKTTIDKEMID
jgi:hypothetical protein